MFFQWFFNVRSIISIMGAGVSAFRSDADALRRPVNAEPGTPGSCTGTEEQIGLNGVRTLEPGRPGRGDVSTHPKCRGRSAGKIGIPHAHSVPRPSPDHHLHICRQNCPTTEPLDARLAAFDHPGAGHSKDATVQKLASVALHVPCQVLGGMKVMADCALIDPMVTPNLSASNVAGPLRPAPSTTC